MSKLSLPFHYLFQSIQVEFSNKFISFNFGKKVRATIEKIEDGKHYFVKVTIGDKLKERLFGTESEADDFIAYLTNNML